MTLSPNDAESIRTLECYQQARRDGYEPLMVVDGDTRLNREDGRGCRLLGSGNLCNVHREAGFSAKPTTCQLYPFTLVNTPDGYFVSTAFTCPAVIAGVGVNASQHADTIRDTLRRDSLFSPSRVVHKDTVRLSARTSIEWPLYLEFEEHLLRRASLEPCLSSALIKGVLELVTYERNLYRDLPAGRESEATSLLFRELARRLHTIVSDISALFEERAEPEKREQLPQKILEERFYSNLVGGEISGYRPYREFDHLLRDILYRYIDNEIRGKLLLAPPNLVTRLLTLAIKIELFSLYYAGKCEVSGVRHFDFSLVEWTFELLEADMMEHDELYLPFVEELQRFAFRIAEVSNPSPPRRNKGNSEEEH